MSYLEQIFSSVVLHHLDEKNGTHCLISPDFVIINHYSPEEFFRKNETIILLELFLIHKPSWKKIDISIAKLCNNDYFRPIKAQVYTRNDNKDKLIGECQFNLHELTNLKTSKYPLNDPVLKKEVGILNLVSSKVDTKPTFLDYIQGGTQLNIILGVDFTHSNGEPYLSTSLHHIKYDNTLNEYQQAIFSVCKILLPYDYDRTVLAYGFGGKPNFQNYSSGVVQHCFPLTGDPLNPWIFDLDGIINAYNHAVTHVEFSGPTLFSPILNEAMKISQSNKDNGSLEYTILLIVTDGEIHDMESTINCLISSADLPLSVIIIGVGSNIFENMHKLDGDNGLCNSQGVKAERDLVQFVTFKDFKNDIEELTQNVLAELPHQLVEYMTRQNIKPGSHYLNRSEKLNDSQYKDPKANQSGIQDSIYLGKSAVESQLKGDSQNQETLAVAISQENIHLCSAVPNNIKIDLNFTK